MQEAKGTIVDKETKLPLSDVLVYNKVKEWSNEQTDSLGKFVLINTSGGISGCPPMTVVIKKSGYALKEVEIPARGERTIELEKETAN